jgi:hypothetical protein
MRTRGSGNSGVVGNYWFAGAALKSKMTGNLGVGFYLVHYGLPDIEKRNALGEKTGKFNATDQTLMISLAYPLSDALSLGASGSIIRQEMVESRLGINTGLGVIYKITERLRGGAAVRNMGWMEKLGRTKDHLEREIALGTSFETYQYMVSADGILGKEGRKVLRTGGEWRMFTWFSLRGGIEFDFTYADIQKPSNLSIGFGWDHEWGDSRRIELDLSIDPTQQIDTIEERNNFTLSYNF